MKIEDMNNNQAYMFNKMIMEFQKDFNYGGSQRLGQAFYNYYYESVFTDPYPLLFFCEDNDRVREMITEALVNYIMEYIK